MTRHGWIRWVSCALALGFATASAAGQEPRVALYDNLGTHTVAISSTRPQAQAYFDQGMRLYYAFNHAEAIRAFEEAARLDTLCAICHWGVALSYGPNINLPMDSASGIAAFSAIERARALSSHANARERALIDALARRYDAQSPADRAALDSAYVTALRGVVDRFPEDTEAATLLAEALMDLSPWAYWEKDGSPRPQTDEILSRLESVLEVYPDHPGANHFYIHAVEAVHPQRAVAAAERLAGLMPGAGHLVHMPGHIYIRVGRYEDAIRANEHAVHADETFIRDHKPEFGVYVAGYYPHNYDFLAFAASMIGRRAQAVQAADRMAELAPHELLGAPGMTFLQHHITRRLQMRVRFEQWPEILAVEAPAVELPHAHAMWQYARGRALAATGDVEGAAEALARVEAAAQNPDLVDQKLEFNTSGRVLAIASNVLAGHIAAARGDRAGAIERLRTAAQLEDALTYGEPPDWSIPVRQDLGRMLMEAGRPVEAETAFREDLERFPDNGWSLHGLAGALRAQVRTAEAAEVEARFRRMWAGADTELARH